MKTIDAQLEAAKKLRNAVMRINGLLTVWESDRWPNETCVERREIKQVTLAMGDIIEAVADWAGSRDL